jgi:F-type H+-transporting ATPase subunit b
MFLLMSEAGGWMEWFNYPGLELWKFLNLAIFTAAGIYFLRTPISAALTTRREAIRRELVAAQHERERALGLVSEAEDLLSRVDEHISAIHKQAQQEAQAERQRVIEAAEREVEKLKQHAQREIEVADKTARKRLRGFLAARSVELARESVRRQMRPEDDTMLIKENLGDFRRTAV